MYLSSRVSTYIGRWRPAACRAVPLDRALRSHMASLGIARRRRRGCRAGRVARDRCRRVYCVTESETGTIPTESGDTEAKCREHYAAISSVVSEARTGKPKPAILEYCRQRVLVDVVRSTASSSHKRDDERTPPPSPSHMPSSI